MKFHNIFEKLLTSSHIRCYDRGERTTILLPVPIRRKKKADVTSIGGEWAHNRKG